MRPYGMQFWGDVQINEYNHGCTCCICRNYSRDHAHFTSGGPDRSIVLSPKSRKTIKTRARRNGKEDIKRQLED